MAAHPAPTHQTVAGVTRIHDPAPQFVEDVAVGDNGVLRGRVFETAGGPLPGRKAGLTVKLIRRGKTVAVTTTGSQGQFSLQNLSEGRYLLVVDHRGTPIRRPCRVWNSPLAPPQARREIRVPIGDPAVRAQNLSPFPIMSLRQAAVVTGIGAGAIAAPVIYHNARIDNRIPATL